MFNLTHNNNVEYKGRKVLESKFYLDRAGMTDTELFVMMIERISNDIVLELMLGFPVISYTDEGLFVRVQYLSGDGFTTIVP